MVWDLLMSRLSSALGLVTENFVIGLADLLVVILFLIIAWIVGGILVEVLKRFLEQIKLEQKLKKRGMHDALLGFSFTDVMSKFVKLMTYAAFLGIAADVVNLTFLYDLVSWFVGYVPLFIQGVAIVVIALLFGDYLTDNIKKANIPFARFAAAGLEIFIAYTALVIALPLILPNANVAILETAFTLLLGSVALALGLGMAIAIGLGGKDVVRDVARKKRADLERLI